MLTSTIDTYNMKRYIWLLFLSSLMIGQQLRSQSRLEYQQAIESVVTNYMDSLAIVGISVAVIKDRYPIYKNSFGYANLEHGVKMTDSSVYRIWSISKQFCAASVLQLDCAGKIDLADPISKYLDSIPPSWKGITIKQLLNHTGGIKDYLNDYKEGEKLHSTPFEIVRDSAAVLKFPPGENWSYTNTGYWVLTKIIETVTDQKYQDYLENQFFIPLAMENTGKMDYFRVIKNRVSGYRSVQGIPQNSTRYLDENHLADGDGELISTLDELIRWALALFSGQIIPMEQLENAWTTSKTNSGEAVNTEWIVYYDDKATYGMGWFISTLGSRKIVWTPGAGRGFSTTLFSVPEEDLHIIVLSNARRFLIADKLAKAIAAKLLDPK